MRKCLKITSYLGAKQKLLDTYLDYMSEVKHNIYIETCVGMGNICLNFPTTARRIVNDINIENALLFKALSSEYAVTIRFLSNLETAHYCERTFYQALNYYNTQDLGNKCLDDFEGDSLADIGSALYVLFRMSYCGIIKKRFNKPDKYSKVHNFEESLYELPNIIERLQGVTVMNVDASELIRMYSDNEDAFIFVDPPYLGDDTDEVSKKRSKNASELYNASLDYDVLLPEMRKSKSKIMMCNYNNERLLNELVNNGWRQIFVGERTIDSGMKRQQAFRERSNEYIYVNY